MGSAPPAKVLLLIPHLGGGGAEHIVATLARCLNCEKYELHLGLVTQTLSESSHFRSTLPNSVHTYALGSSRVRVSAWRLVKLVWHTRPAVILSGMAHLNLLVLFLRPLFPSGTRILVRQNGALSASLGATNRPRLSRLLFRFGYKRADRVICQTNSMAQELQSLDIDKAKLVTLPNPVDILRIRASANRTDRTGPSSRQRLLAVARLASEKGIDLLLEAFAGIADRFPSAELQIAGAGSCDAALKTQCTLLGIDRRVKFLGYVESLAQHYNNASVFVLPSRHEGLPNALLEAAAAGLPIVATPASDGLATLLRDKPGVWMTSEISAKSLGRTLSDALAALPPAQRFHHDWIDPFDLHDAVIAYEGEIDRALLETRT